MRQEHNVDVDADAWTMKCSCGWTAGPFSGPTEAGTAMGEHKFGMVSNQRSTR